MAKFPIDILEKVASFDFSRFFGYVTPDIKSWEKQDQSLEDLEELMEMTYWGTVRMKRPQVGPQGNDTTATEVKSNDAPKEARLNLTADWVESVENRIADFIRAFWFDSQGASAIRLSRDYVLRSPEELRDNYLTLKSKGSPDFLLDEAMERYLKAKYQNNPVQLTKYLKQLDVEPFPHDTVTQIEASPVVPFQEKLNKRFFGEWCNTIQDGQWVSLTAVQLKEMLDTYVKAKNIAEPAPEPKPIMN